MHIIEIFLKCVLFYIPFIRLILPGKWETHGVLLWKILGSSKRFPSDFGRFGFVVEAPSQKKMTTD